MVEQTADETNDETTDRDKIQFNIPAETLTRLREAYPHAINDAERARQALGDAIEMQEAKAVTIERR